MLWLGMATESCEGEPWMESQWLPVSLVVWITALAGTLDARQQARFVATLHRAALRPRPPHRRQLAARLRHGARLQTLLLPARQRGTQDPGDRQSLAPHPPQATPRRWCGYAVGLRHRRLPHQAVRAARRGRRQASQPHPRDRPGPRSSTATSGSVWPAWSDTPLWGAIALPILAHLYIRGQGCRLDGGLLRRSTRSWNWPPPR